MATGAGPPIIRGASVDDAAACAAIYAPYVTGTAVTFETEPPDAAAWPSGSRRRCGRTRGSSLEQDGRVRGYAYGGPFKPARPTAGPARSASTSSPADGARVPAGGSTRACFERLAERGYRTAVAGHDPAQRGQRRPAPGDGLRARRHLPARSATSSAPGTTSTGASGRWPPSATRPPSPADRRAGPQAGSTSIQTASAEPSSSPAAVKSAEPVWSLRPSRRAGQAVRTWSSPARAGAAELGRQATRGARAPRRPNVFVTSPLGQSSAAQANSGRTAPSGPARSAPGRHGAAYSARPVTGPGKMRRPSPGARRGPQTKHVG